eukprot:gb/GFBE01024779.1/.p1 GENE.gb/GFBE01024779.1/~~gb/GFBE01024779.1/.p1  ORF type:complete len:496 (+),score=119.22 gb/GFBE01024779.1/:1-1488(+)
MSSWMLLCVLGALCVAGILGDAGVMMRDEKTKVEVGSSGEVISNSKDEAEEAHVKPHTMIQAEEGEEDERQEDDKESSYEDEREDFEEHGRKLHVSSSQMAQLLEDSKFMPEPVRRQRESMVEVDFHSSHKHRRAVREVQFGIYVRRVVRVDVLAKTWTGDLVITTSWNDPDVKKSLKEGQTEARFATEDARKFLWLPDIGITNRDFKNVEVISSSIKIWNSGWATKVERVMATMENDFDTSAYPWDQQTLRVVLASTKLMADELVLKPHTDASLIGVSKEVLKGTGFIGKGDASLPTINISSFEEADAMLVKSRGVFTLDVIRNPGASVRSLFGPTLILLSVSYINFWFPLLAPFSMPRLASSVIPLLCMITFTTKSKMPDSWTDVYNETICLLIACVSILSITVEVTLHSAKNEAFAQELNFQYRIGFPIACLFFILLNMAFVSGEYNDVCTSLVRTLIIVILGVNIWRVWKRNKDDAAPKAPEPADAPAPSS